MEIQKMALKDQATLLSSPDAEPPDPSLAGAVPDVDSGTAEVAG